MAIYLKKFETMSQYNAYTADTENFILPNVSLTVDNSTVHYNPSSPVPPTPSHDYVEIGGVKWATMNVGANSITDTGLYFQWGDTQGYTAAQVGEGEGKKYFGWADYKYGNGTSEPGTTGMTKYNATDGKITLEPTDDAVTVAWGGGWRMPRDSEFAALGEAIDFIDSSGTTITASDKLTTLSGVTGILVADKNDHSKRLFFPAAGNCSKGNIKLVDSFGYYWSSSLNTYVIRANILSLSSSFVNWKYGNDRYGGYSVRGVLDE